MRAVCRALKLVISMPLEDCRMPSYGPIPDVSRSSLAGWKPTIRPRMSEQQRDHRMLAAPLTHVAVRIPGGPVSVAWMAASAVSVAASGRRRQREAFVEPALHAADHHLHRQTEARESNSRLVGAVAVGAGAV